LNQADDFLCKITKGGYLKILFLLLGLANSLAIYAVQPLTITEVDQGIYVHFGRHEMPDKTNHGAIANIGFIVGNRCVAVIDTGGNPEQGYALRQTIENTTDKPVCYVINTHVHPDHIYGNIAFKQPNVTFLGHQHLAQTMAVRGGYYIDKAAEQLALNLTADHIIPPDKAIKKHLLIDLGGRQLRLTAHPSAHSDSDLTVLDLQTNTLWMADLLFRQHIPVIDGSLKGWLKEINRMEKQTYHLVIPGHGDLVRNWPQGLQPEKHYLQTLMTEIRQMIDQGVFLEQAVETVGYSERDNWQLFDQFHKRNITTAYAELEWED